MKVTFLLPGPSYTPIGGVKVVYEYANGLVALNHHVNVVHAPLRYYGDHSYLYDTLRNIEFLGRSIGLRQGFRPDRWFQVDPRVHLLWVPSLHKRWVPDGDVIIASAWQTGEWAATYGPLKGQKVFLVHDYEHYMTANLQIKSRMGQVFRNGFYNIVTSPAGQSMLEELEAPIGAYIPNGIDFATYKCTTPIISGDRHRIGFAARTEPFKGTQDIIEALTIVRQSGYSSVKIWGFGRPGFEVPEWVDYKTRPTDTELCAYHNQSKIFVVGSHYEGWGLPGAEAMACGSALVSTDNGGVRAYAEHEITALLSSPRDPASLAQHILLLLRNDDKRVQIAQRGLQRIEQFDWDTSIRRMDQIIQGKEHI